jgi:hypothetical protein
VATVTVGSNPVAFGKFIDPPIPVAAFSATVEIVPSAQAFAVRGTFTLGPGGTFDPVTDPVTVQLGEASVTIPEGAFDWANGRYVFFAVVDGVPAEGSITPLGGMRYAFEVSAAGVADLPTTLQVAVSLTVGHNIGTSGPRDPQGTPAAE